METPQDLQKPCVWKRTIVPLSPGECPSFCENSCSALSETSNVRTFQRMYFPVLASLLCWFHKCTPGKAIVSGQ